VPFSIYEMLPSGNGNGEKNDWAFIIIIKIAVICQRGIPNSNAGYKN
jgi:hypothetical protein